LLAFIPLPLIPGTISAVIVFSFTYLCIHYLHQIHPSTPFPAISSLPHYPLCPSWNMSYSLGFLRAQWGPDSFSRAMPGNRNLSDSGPVKVPGFSSRKYFRFS
jgi:hypothetical protein